MVFGYWLFVYFIFFLRKWIFKENKYENVRFNEGYEGEGVFLWNKLFILIVFVFWLNIMMFYLYSYFLIYILY